MTHDILQSDVTLARRLLDEQRPDPEIILALTHRGVDSARAAKLLEDLRSGGKVVVQSVLPAEMRLSRRSRSRKGSPERGEGSPARSGKPASRRPPSAARVPGGPKNPTNIRGVVLVIVILVLIAAGFTLFRRSHAEAPAPAEQGPKAANSMVANARRLTPVPVVAATHESAATPLVLELQADGLRLGGSLVDRSDLLAALTKRLGLPTRTNQVAQTGALTYAFDRHGLLIYARPAGAASSLVLDCEATGGANGTTSSFAGTLKIGDQAISPDTDSRTLAGMKKLGLGEPGSGGTIWRGRYENWELVFAYLKSPSRLSLIEIDWK